MFKISIKDKLKEEISDYSKLLFLGVGNVLKSDDGVGPYIIDKLEDISSDNIILLDAQTVPENFTGKIRKEQPSHLIIIDACLMDSEPGDVKIVDREDFNNIGISTHSMSLSYFVKYLEQENDFKVIFIGIEPNIMEFANALTPNVKEGADNLIEIIREII
ncbi:MAG: hydrogenase maturation peptidase HycI [Methanobrevibacter sp.]|uniref:hydrogenase maturation peptidase HycI n=1 Tax=Methanobrevibacter sp. TaxID=66852 RepID=UPI0026DEEAEF|nr:hydrogenase maturation peptidase HycI [Methanobrevibacter sp.]MDO5848364.1 hydrogenase maturation peptidase HycI [Methanobrevibacter sp.]